MKKIISLFLVVILSSVIWADTSKYTIIFSDKTKRECDILENDPLSKRLKIQSENNMKMEWLSYYSIQAIIEASSQKDVTDEFIQPLVKETESRLRTEYSSADAYILILIMGIAAFVIFATHKTHK